MKRIWRLLRSRSLALWTIIALVMYAAAATVLGGDDYSAPYRSPLFFGIAGLLALSTGACAWERTRAALAGSRLRLPSAATRRRLRDTATLELPVSDDVQAIEVSTMTLKRLGMHVVRDEEALEARMGVAGAFGSPLFHWALTLLFVVIVLGQLTRAEGLMGVAAGAAKPDAPDSYGELTTGPLAGALTGRLIAVPSIETSYTANNVEQGITPFVEIRSAAGDEVLASGYAYANHPIRYRSMLVHRNNDGLAAVVEISDGSGAVTTEHVMLDYDAERTRVLPALFGLSGPTGETVTSVMLQPGPGSTPASPSVRIRAAAGDASPETQPQADVVLRIGEQTQLPGGLSLRVIELTKYARLSVVDDWSVYWIYALFSLAVTGLALAIFFPLRRVRAVVVRSDEAHRLHVATRHGRGDPGFPVRVESVLRAALSAEEDGS